MARMGVSARYIRVAVNSSRGRTTKWPAPGSRIRPKIGSESNRGRGSQSIEPSSELTGIHELQMEIGATAIDLLASKLHRRERGLPVTPTATLVDGRWHAGKSCPPR